MKKNNNTNYDTEYSSELDVFFSEKKEDCLLSSSGLKNQLENSNKIQTNKKKTNSDNDELISWASRLELESITLKDLIKDDFLPLIKESNWTLKKTFSNISSCFYEIKTSIDEIKKTMTEQSEMILKKKDVDSTENEVNKTTIVDLVKKIVEQSTKEMVEILGSEIMNNIIEQNKKHEKIKKDITILKRDLAESQKKDTYFCSKTRILDMTENEPFKNNDVVDEIKEIKLYLKLLLPRLIGIENSFFELSQKYEKISELFLSENNCNTDLNSRKIEVLKSYSKNMNTKKKRKKVF